jgi:hypothetical protein
MPLFSHHVIASGRSYWGAPDDGFSSFEPAVLQLLHVGAVELQ